MDLPEVHAGARLKATVPIGDSESLQRLRERTEDTVTRPAGSTALVDATIRSTAPAGNRPRACRRSVRMVISPQPMRRRRDVAPGAG